MHVAFVDREPIAKLGILYLAGALRRAGHTAELFIATLEKDLPGAVRKSGAGLVAFSATTPEHGWALRAAKALKEATGLPTVLGGPHASFAPRVVEDASLDYAARGDCEAAVVDLAGALETGADASRVPNLWTIRDGARIENPLRPLEHDLDRLAHPDRSLLAKYPHLAYFMEQAPAITVRGCPYECTFCFNKAYWEMYGVDPRDYVRRRSPEDAVAELAALRRDGARGIKFVDDTFNLTPEWFEKWAPLYRKEVGLPYNARIRADWMTDDLARLMKEAGPVSLSFGIEASDEESRNGNLKKALADDAIDACAAILRRRRIPFQTFNIIGLPGETFEQAVGTLRRNIRLKPNHAWCSIMQVYPETGVAARAREMGLLPEGFDFKEVRTGFFDRSYLRMGRSREIENLHKLFNTTVMLPFLLPLVLLLVRLPPNALFRLVFKLAYAVGSFRMGKIDLRDALLLSRSVRLYFSRQEEEAY